MADDATPVEAGDIRIVQLTPPMPLTLAAAIYQKLDEACEEQGYTAICKVEDGLGVVWARPKIGQP